MGAIFSAITSGKNIKEYDKNVRDETAKNQSDSYCNKCGHEIDKNDNFCTSCGKKFE